MKVPQTDTTAVALPQEAAETQQAAQPVPRKKTVWQVIRSLPPGATPAQQDSAVQAAFDIPPLTWPDTARTDLPLGSAPAAKWELEQVDLYRLPYSGSCDWKIEEAVYEPPGIAGDPMPYRFRSDDYVTGLLMLSFFLVAWVIARSWHFLAGSVKGFFFDRTNKNMFDSRTDSELRGQLFLVVQTCFILGVLFFDYTQERMVQVFNQISPYRVLAVGVALCLAYYVLKLALYSFVNYVFFDRRQATQWVEVYFLSILALGLALLPVTLLVVFFDIAFRALAVLFLLILGLVKVLLFYKCGRIFFRYRAGWMHLILYFCALEIFPLLILWRALAYANQYLMTLDY